MNMKSVSDFQGWFWRSMPLAFAFAILVGCGESSKFQLAPVSGIVTLDGEPLIDAVVNFQPMASTDDGIAGIGSNARTDQQGRFVMNTIDEHPGAVVGKHRVRIYSYSPESALVEDTDSGPSKERVLERYNYRSKLTLEVPAAGTEEADFDLKLP